MFEISPHPTPLPSGEREGMGGRWSHHRLNLAVRHLPGSKPNTATCFLSKSTWLELLQWLILLVSSLFPEVSDPQILDRIDVSQGLQGVDGQPFLLQNS